MNRLSFLSVFPLLLLVLLAGCQMSQQLKAHRSTLKQLAYSNLPENQKFDALAEELVLALEGALNQPSPVKTYRYINKFSKQNDPSLDRIGAELNTWIKDMRPGRKVAFVTSTLSQPYARKLVQLIPQLEQRMRSGGYKLGKLEKILLLYKVRQLLKN